MVFSMKTLYERIENYLKEQKKLFAISYAELSRKFGKSRQAVHQVIKEMENEKKLVVIRTIADEGDSDKNLYEYIQDPEVREVIEYKGNEGMSHRKIETKGDMFKSKVDGQWYNNSERYGKSSMTKKQAKARYWERKQKNVR